MIDTTDDVRIGDMLVAVDILDLRFGKLTMGKSYRVTGIQQGKKHNTEEWLRIASDDGEWWYHGFRFSRVQPDGWSTL